MPKKQRTKSDKPGEILREVKPEEAFHFYRAVDVPLNTSARSLSEFVERVKTVEAASLQFHVERQDFERWFAMLGDSELVAKVAGIRASMVQGELLRPKLFTAVRNRLDQLSRATMNIPR
jgi:Family of unknown function (DUF5752)